MVVLHLAGVLMEHFLEGIALLRNWYILFFKVNGALPQENVPLRHAQLLFMS